MDSNDTSTRAENCTVVILIPLYTSNNHGIHTTMEEPPNKHVDSHRKATTASNGITDCHKPL